VCYGWEPAWEEIKAYLEIADVLVCDTALM